ncbi:glycosyltransferase family 2 protein [Bremerella cremea]
MTLLAQEDLCYRLAALAPVRRIQKTPESQAMRSSVIITTHNRPYYLDKVLYGFMHQTEKPHEVVIADDGSSDNTPEIIEKYRQQADFPILHAWHPFGGMPQISKTRNNATRAATGDYLIYTDGDCIPGPQFVADHRRIARPGHFVQGRRNFLQYKGFDSFKGTETSWELVKAWMKGHLTKLHLTIRIPGFATRSNTTHGVRSCNLAVWKSDVANINGWNEAFVGFWREDSEFVTRLMRSGVKRLNAVYSAVVFHMEHEKFFIEADFDRNNALWEASKTGPVFIEKGMMPPPRPTAISFQQPQATSQAKAA